MTQASEVFFSDMIHVARFRGMVTSARTTKANEGNRIVVFAPSWTRELGPILVSTIVRH